VSTTFTERDAALVIPEVDIGESYWATGQGIRTLLYKGVWWLQGADVSGQHSF